MYIETIFHLGGNRTWIAGLLSGHSPSELAGPGVQLNYCDQNIIFQVELAHYCTGTGQICFGLYALQQEINQFEFKFKIIYFKYYLMHSEK